MTKKKIGITTIEKPDGQYPVNISKNEPNQEIDSDVPKRAQWGNRAEFLLSCISLSVGLGNVWRFPYLAYANGGGAFLIPYICILFLVGKPMYFMEIAFGQYHSQGPVKIWQKVVPLARGIGAAQVLVSLFVAIFYVIIMAWTMYYFWATLIAACKGEDTPWSNFCDSDWAHKESCVRPNQPTIFSKSEIPVVIFSDGAKLNGTHMVSASQQYYDRAVMMKYDQGKDTKYSIRNLGSINLYMLACLAGSWLLVFLSLIFGVKSSGKVVYITSTMPFIVLFILLGRGASLAGAVEGIKYFIIPKFDRLLDIQVWKAAAEQMFFSLSVAYGSLTMLGSYNKFNNNCYQDGIIVSVLDTMTSVVAGLAMFSVLGYLAGQLDVGIEKVVTSGPGLAFVTFPEAVNQMPAPHLWGILLYTLGLGSEIGLLENVLSFICDKFPELRKKRPLVAAVGCSALFLIGLPFITQGGYEVFDIFNEYAGGISVLFVALFEIIMLMWVYGLNRFVNNMREMLGKTGDLGYYWKTTWICLSPLTLAFILVISLVMYKPMSADDSRSPRLPDWADGIGWGIAGITILQLPLWAVITVYKASGRNLTEKIKQSLWPDHIMKQMEPPMELNQLPIYKDVIQAHPTVYSNSGYDPAE